MCRSKHVEQLRNIGIINSTTLSHLVGYFCKIYIMMHGSMNIKLCLCSRQPPGSPCQKPGSDSGVQEHATSTGRWLPTFRRIVLLSSPGSSSPRRLSKRPKTLIFFALISVRPTTHSFACLLLYSHVPCVYFILFLYLYFFPTVH